MRRSPRRITAAVAALALAAAGVVALAPPASAASGDLLFSEYIEGSANNKALEIYNPTTAPVDLAAAGYSVQLYVNGGHDGRCSRSPLTGTIAPDDVFVLASSAAATPGIARCGRTRPPALASTTATTRSHSTRAGAIVDVIGQIGVDPGHGVGLRPDLDGRHHPASRRRHLRRRRGRRERLRPAVSSTASPSDTADGSAHTTPTARCTLRPIDPGPDPGPVADCDLDVVTIGSVQGQGATSPLASDRPCASRASSSATSSRRAASAATSCRARSPDEDALTSEGVFVYAPGDAPVEVSIG